MLNPTVQYIPRRFVINTPANANVNKNHLLEKMALQLSKTKNNSNISLLRLVVCVRIVASMHIKKNQKIDTRSANSFLHNNSN